jgi:uncharacterized membrane protein YphA (DoxX/SURF4 family)
MTVQKLFIILGILAIAVAAFRHYRKNSEGILLNTLQYFLGFVFIFSGVVKAIDPLGTSYKMHEYFESFAKDGLPALWEKMSTFSLPISILMIVAEIILGMALVLGWKSRWTTIGLLAINLFFLYLTGYSYLSGFCLTLQVIIVAAFLLMLLFLSSFIGNNKKRFQGIVLMSILLILYFIYCKATGNCATCVFDKTKMKVTDCGCFGDFMKLQPWETFYKDIFLTFITLYLVKSYHKINEFFTTGKTRMTMIIVSVLAIAFALYSSFGNEPIVDFRPYAIGSDIKEKMKEIEPREVINKFVYKDKTTGKEQLFGMDNLPTTDSVYQWVSTQDSVIKEGIPAPIHNLRFSDMEGNDITPSMLNEEATSFWIVIYNSKITNSEFFDKTVIPFATEMKKQGVNVYCILGNSTKEFDDKAYAAMDVVKADETALKTMIRSNPGVMQIKNGKVINKWHYRQFSKEKVGL